LETGFFVERMIVTVTMKKVFMIFIILLLLPFHTFAVQDTVHSWIYFDSAQTVIAVDSQKDLAIQELSAIGFRKYYQSRWQNALSGTLPRDSIGQLTRFPFIKTARPLSLYKRTQDENRALPLAKSAVTDPLNPFYGNSAEGLELIRATALIDKLRLATSPLPGEGIRIALFDSGFRTRHACFSHFTENTIIAKRDYVIRMINPAIPFDTTVEDDSMDYQGNILGNHQENHGTSVLSLIAAYQPGILMGIAPFAKFALVKTERTVDLLSNDV